MFQPCVNIALIIKTKVKMSIRMSWKIKKKSQTNELKKCNDGRENE